MHGQRTDIAARKLERLHREAIRRDHHVAAVQRDRRGVDLGVEFGVGEVAREYLLDQLPHEAPAVTVCQRNPVVFHQSLPCISRAAISAAWPKLSAASLHGNSWLR